MSRFSEAFPAGDLPANLNTFFGYRLPKPAPADTNADSVPGHLCWGKVGSLAEGKLSTGDSFEVLDCDERHAEVNRKTDLVRVENPDEPQDWVEIKRTSEAVFNKTEKKVKAPTNSSTEAPDFGDFAPSPVEFSSFKPLGAESEQKCKLTVKFNNGPATNN